MVCLYGVDRVCDQLCEFKVIDGYLIVGASVVDCSEAQTQHDLQIQQSWIEMSKMIITLSINQQKAGPIGICHTQVIGFRKELCQG